MNAPGRLILIAGPCVIESENLCLQVASALKETCDRLGVFYVFKASYDKANRTSAKSFRGPGLEEGLAVLANVRARVGVPVLTDVHTEAQATAAARVADILQIPAFLCRQTDLIAAAVRTGRIVNLKKGQFLSPEEMGQVVGKAKSAGGKKLLVTERGTTFGYHNLVADMRSIPIMRRFGFPVIFDATHSVQLPGGGGDRSGGQREFAPVLARSRPGGRCQRHFHRNPPRSGPCPERRAEHDSACRYARFAEKPPEGLFGCSIRCPARKSRLERWEPRAGNGLVGSSPRGSRSATLAAALRRIRLLLCDVDGVLTDATVFIGLDGEMKQFNIRDGLGLVAAQRQGLKVGWISGRPSPATARRAKRAENRFPSAGEGQ